MSRRRVAIAAVLAPAAVAALLVIPALASEGTDAERLAATGLAFESFLALLAIAAASLSRKPLGERLGLAPSRLSLGALVVLVGGTLCLSYALDGVLEVSGLGEHSALFEFEAQLEGLRGGALAFALLSFALAPGVAEELLCRGLIQRGLQERVGPAAAIALSALLFGALHVEPVHAVAAGVLGLYLGVAAHLGGSVRTSIVCHAANNALAVGAAAMVVERGDTGPIAIVAAVSVSLGALGWVWRQIGDSPHRPGPPCSGARPGLQPSAGSDDS